MPSGAKKRKAAKKKKEILENFKDDDPTDTQTKEESNDVHAVEPKISDGEDNVNSDAQKDDESTMHAVESVVTEIPNEQPFQQDDHFLKIEEIPSKQVLITNVDEMVSSVKSKIEEQIERLKRTVVEELRVTDEIRTVLQKALDDLDTICLP